METQTLLEQWKEEIDLLPQTAETVEMHIALKSKIEGYEAAVRDFNITPVDNSYDWSELKARNIWHSYKYFQEVVDFFDSIFIHKTSRWHYLWSKWYGNAKYITIRFDLRDGGHIIMLDTKERIVLEDLKCQIKP